MHTIIYNSLRKSGQCISHLVFVEAVNMVFIRLFINDTQNLYLVSDWDSPMWEYFMSLCVQFNEVVAMFVSLKIYKYTFII